MLLIKQKHETSFIQCSAVYENRTYGAMGGAESQFSPLPYCSIPPPPILEHN